MFSSFFKRGAASAAGLASASYLPPSAGGKQHMTRRDHYLRDTRYLRRQPFGRGVSPKRTVLLVPELRKRRMRERP